MRKLLIGLAAAVAIGGIIVGISTQDNGLLPQAGAADPQAAAKDPGALVPFLRFTGSGTVSVNPDTATITAGETGRGATAKAAMDDAQGRLRSLTAALRSAAAGATIATDPVSTYQDEQKRWIATASVTVSKLPVDSAQAVLQAAINANADQVSGPYFALERTSDAENEAVRRALAAARAKADAAAAAMGVHVTGIVSVDESSGGGGPIPMMIKSDAVTADSAASAPPVVLPGTIDVSVMVTVTFAYGS